MKTLIAFFVLLIALTGISKAQQLNANSSLNKASKQYFIENKGQWPQEVLYMTRINGLNAWITRDGITYDFYKYDNANPSFENNLLKNKFPLQRNKDTLLCHGQVVRLKLINSQTNCSPKGIEKQACYYNYFIGNDPTQWASNVNLYNEVHIEGVYDGVDMKYYYDNASIRCDYVLAPGVDPGKINILPEGANNYGINSLGELTFTTRFGEVRQAQIFAYQEVANVKTQVNCSFVKSEDGKISFKVDGYNPILPLIIDPLLYSTFIGGSGQDNGYTIEVDKNGNAFIIGCTKTNTFPTTIGAYDRTQNGNYDVFITKLNSTGTALVFSTFLGGSGEESGYQRAVLTVDSLGYIYTSGYTYSSNFPTTIGAFDRNLDGSYDIFVTKFTPSGDTLVYSTLIGGSNSEGSVRIITDKNGNVIIAGYTDSYNYPTTHGAYDTSFNGVSDAIITKLNSTGSALIFSTFIGGNSSSNANDLALDQSMNIYIAGQTAASNFPTTSGVFDKTYNGNYDIFVTKFNANCSALNYSTYIGGSNYENVYSIAVDQSGNVYISGFAMSGYPTTVGSFDTSFQADDGFVTKINATGTSLLFSTCIGGLGNGIINGMQIDAIGNTYMVGQTGNVNFYVTPDAFDKSFNSSSYAEGFIAKLNTTGSKIIYSTFLGGNDVDILNDIALDGSGAIYVTGYSWSTDYPITTGAYDNTSNGHWDVVVTKLQLCTPYTISTGNNSPFCEGGKLDLTVSKIGLSYAWTGPNGFTSTLKNPSINKTVYANAGKYMVTVMDSSGCPGYDSTKVIIYPLPTGITNSNSPLCDGDKLNLSTTKKGNSYAWTGPNSFTSNLQNPSINISALVNSGKYFVNVIDSNGCHVSDSTSVIINPLPTVTPGSNSPVTVGNTLNLTVNSTTGATYSWSGPKGFTSAVQNPTKANVVLSDSGYYKVLVTSANGCSKKDSIKVVIKKGTSLGSTNHDQQQVFIYPNPSNRELYIRLTTVEKEAMVEIFDISGKRVLKQTFKNTNNFKLDISQLPTGTYNIRYLSNSTALVKRIVIEK